MNFPILSIQGLNLSSDMNERTEKLILCPMTLEEANAKEIPIRNLIRDRRRT